MEIHPRLFPMGSHRTGGHGWCLRGSEGWISVLPASLGWLWFGLWPCEHHRERARHGRRGLGSQSGWNWWNMTGWWFIEPTNMVIFFWEGFLVPTSHKDLGDGMWNCETQFWLQAIVDNDAKASGSENPWAHGPFFMNMFGVKDPMVFSRIWENSKVLQFYQCFIVYDHSFLEWQFGGMSSFREGNRYLLQMAPPKRNLFAFWAMVDGCLLIASTLINVGNYVTRPGGD